jgi:opacity protein-like surface antigen
MSSRRLMPWALLLLPLLLATRPAAAQTYYYSPGPLHWYVMGGLNQPVGGSSQLLQSGWNVGGGLEVRQANSPLSLRVEVSYAANNAAHELIDEGQEQTGLQITGGWADIWSGMADAEFHLPLGHGIEAYALGGVGVYYTRFSLTEYGYGYVCNPWWNYCYFASGNAVVARHDDTKFGWNAGAGVSFDLHNGMSLFVEARYNAVQLPQTLEFVPINIGVRF